MMRIGGLATGMDTESIIKNMMEANRLPLSKITQKKQALEWQLDNYRSINRDLNKFSTSIFDNMILSDTFTKKIMDVSNSDALSVRNLSSTGDFSGTIKIGQLAKNSTMQGGKVIANNEDGNPDPDVKVTTSSTLEELGFKLEDGKTSITINAIGADGTMPKNKDGVEEGVTLTFKSTDTLQSVLDKINKETGVTAFFDSKSGQIGVSSKNGGALPNIPNDPDDLNSVEVNPPEIVISGELGTALKINNVDINDPNDPTNYDPDKPDYLAIAVTGGQNAKFEFNGMQMERSSNTFQINGFEFTLKDTTATYNEATGKVEGNGSVTFNSTPDVDNILDSVVKFVDEYNKLIESLNDKLREPKHRDFHPLSAEEKADMKEKEIELWEEKAMSGQLRNDPIVSSMLSQMRTALMGAVGDQKTGPNLKSIGITTSKSYLDNGKLVIDEKALREAIAEDPDKVHQLFAGGDEKDKVEDQGFARRLRTAVQAAETKVTERAGKTGDVNDTFTLGKNLNDMDKQILRFEDRLKMTENRLWKQFTAMEVAIQKANAQSASLMNSFGGA